MTIIISLNLFFFSTIDLGNVGNFFYLVNSIDLKIGFLSIRMKRESKRIFWKMFNSPQMLTYNDNKENLAGEFNFTNSEFSIIELTDSRFGMITSSSYIKTINNQEHLIMEIHVRFLESNAIKFSQPYLLYTVKNSVNKTNIWNYIIGILIFPL